MIQKEAIEIIREFIADLPYEVTLSCAEAHAIDEAIDALDDVPWIPISERLPNEGEYVKVRDASDYKGLHVLFYSNGVFFFVESQESLPHWYIEAWKPISGDPKSCLYSHL